jgi:hypothetical protein
MVRRDPSPRSTSACWMLLQRAARACHPSESSAQLRPWPLAMLLRAHAHCRPDGRPSRRRRPKAPRDDVHQLCEGCRGLMARVKASGWSSFDRQFEPYLPLFGTGVPHSPRRTKRAFYHCLLVMNLELLPV